ncbi:MAG: hypothetical protein QNI84_10675 [Henriciella sp.]|nr:hypothetical protein [Henriciella sp.]
MKHHILIALGLLMGVMFSYRLAGALTGSGFGFWQLYLLGGLALSAALIYAGLKERQRLREASEDKEP